MKKTKLVLIGCLIFFILSISAQVMSFDTLRIEHYNDGTIDSMSISKIDSITFSVDTIWGGGLGNVLLPGNTTCDSQYISVSGCAGMTSITYNGYEYDLLEIGGQCWFKENLQTNKYRDGSPIDYPTLLNISTGAYTWYYTDSSTYASNYGALYNGYAVNDTRGLCPSGWHIPTDCEWMYLEGKLGMSTSQQDTTGFRGTNEGGMLKDTTLWNSPNSGATNSSGFSGLPGGLYHYNIAYGNIKDMGYWWSSTEHNGFKKWSRFLHRDYSSIGRQMENPVNGLSIRCLKD